MTDNTLRNYFSFTPTQSVKRSRSHSSPESDFAGVKMANKVGDLTHDELMASLAKLMDSKLANLATKDDFKGLSDQVNLLSEENRGLKHELSQLQSDIKSVNTKLLDLEGRSRRNNLIFKGLKWNSNATDFRRIVGKFCIDRLGASENIWINRAHTLGQSDTIIAHIPSDTDVEFIMSRTGQLKGTGYVVHRDYPREVREKRGYLMAVRAEVERVAGGRRMPLVYDHVTIERERFTWEEEGLMAGRQDGGEKLQRIFKHDFDGFLSKLKQQGVGQRQPRDRKMATSSNAASASQPTGSQEVPRTTNTTTLTKA